MISAFYLNGYIADVMMKPTILVGYKVARNEVTKSKIRLLTDNYLMIT